MTTLKLEVGKSYRTSNGLKILIIRKNDKFRWDVYPYYADNSEWYTEDGKLDRLGDDPRDLISEWQDEPGSKLTDALSGSTEIWKKPTVITNRREFARAALTGLLANGYDSDLASAECWRIADLAIKAGESK